MHLNELKSSAFKDSKKLNLIATGCIDGPVFFCLTSSDALGSIPMRDP